MGKALGISAFVILLLSLPIPVVGNYISLLAVLILCAAAWCGEKTWVWVVDIVAWVKMFMLSPTWHMMMFSSGYMRGMAREMQSLGTSDAVLDGMAQGSIKSASGINNGTFWVTVLILAAPVAILVFKSFNATPARDTDQPQGPA